MRLQSWMVLGFAMSVVAACGGGVSLGDTGGGDAGSDGGAADSGGDGAAVTCASAADCGPFPLAPSVQCPDGSLGGNTGRCLKTAAGCAWEQRACPPAACFDAAGALDKRLAKCGASTDCVVVPFQINCCGSMHAAGVNLASKSTVEKCAADRAAAFPACGCPTSPTLADDGSSETGSGGTPSVVCNVSTGLCETSFKGEVCGGTTCKPGSVCCSGVPFPSPTCVDGGGGCPVSQRKHKKDITYLSLADRERLSDELLRFPLATYRYKSDGESDRAHLGFIIDDVSPSPAVLASGERVDMYGYQTMAVATLQVQARELAALRRELDELKRTCAAKR